MLLSNGRLLSDANSGTDRRFMQDVSIRTINPAIRTLRVMLDEPTEIISILVCSIPLTYSENSELSETLCDFMARGTFKQIDLIDLLPKETLVILVTKKGTKVIYKNADSECSFFSPKYTEHLVIDTETLEIESVVSNHLITHVFKLWSYVKSGKYWVINLK